MLPNAPAVPKGSKIPVFLRGQFFLFDKQDVAPWPSKTGFRALLVLVGMEAAVRPLLGWAGSKLHLQAQTWWTMGTMIVLLAAAAALTIRFAGVRLARVGFLRWREWTIAERFYFLETVPLTILIFSCINAGRLHALFAHPRFGQITIFMFVPQILWGIYQEFLYRGLLQSEFVRRWGTLRGLLASNLIFTFGPLHAYHFSLAKGNPNHLWIFAGIFSIGMFFGLVYRYSRNLWIVGVLHGLGDWFIDGLAHAVRF